ncbi:MAG: undecaprenyldiphospho-muramoylpentapeptide beta-N-acetylglucosaminyltransferase [Granulosicoccus sp.]
MSSSRRRAVVIAAGGTGGHVVPALAVAAVLKSQNVPVVWFGTKRGLEATMVPADGIQMCWIDVAGLRGKTVFETLLGPFRLGRALVQSVRQMRALKPRAVLGMGGFVSGPVGLAALLLRKPLVLHEQNAVAGMTNRWLSGFATRVFSAWPNVFKASRNATVVGNPVRADMEALAGEPAVINSDASQPLRVLVVGGSRGASALNELVPQAIALMNQSVVVHHQSGRADAADVRMQYRKATYAQVLVSEFIEDMTQAYQSADVVICRSGAMTVTELGAIGLPGILVPFPYAVDDHQTLNARHLSDLGAALLMPQSTLSAQSLAKELMTLSEDRQKLEMMSVAARGCFVPNAAATVAYALLEVSR